MSSFHIEKPPKRQQASAFIWERLTYRKATTQMIIFTLERLSAKLSHEGIYTDDKSFRFYSDKTSILFSPAPFSYWSIVDVANNSSTASETTEKTASKAPYWERLKKLVKRFKYLTREFLLT